MMMNIYDLVQYLQPLTLAKVYRDLRECAYQNEGGDASSAMKIIKDFVDTEMVDEERRQFNRAIK